MPLTLTREIPDVTKNTGAIRARVLFCYSLASQQQLLFTLLLLRPSPFPHPD